MSDEDKKKVIEVRDGDSIIVLHGDHSISLYEGEDDATTFYINLLQFILTDEELLPELEEIYLEKRGMSEEQADGFGLPEIEFTEEWQTNGEDEGNDEKKKFPKLPKPDPGKKWKPYELN